MGGYYPNVPLNTFGVGGYNPYFDASTASNQDRRDNPAFTADDFYGWFPAFRGQIEPVIIDRFIVMANATVKESRWHEDWFWGMCYFVAHFATVFLRTQTATPDPTALQVVEAAQVKGLISSESVDGLSTSYDLSTVIPANIQSWGSFTSTAYGLEFAKKAWPKGRGPMLVR